MLKAWTTGVPGTQGVKPGATFHSCSPVCMFQAHNVYFGHSVHQAGQSLVHDMSPLHRWAVTQLYRPEDQCHADSEDPHHDQNTQCSCGDYALNSEENRVEGDQRLAYCDRAHDGGHSSAYGDQNQLTADLCLKLYHHQLLLDQQRYPEHSSEPDSEERMELNIQRDPDASDSDNTGEERTRSFLPRAQIPDWCEPTRIRPSEHSPTRHPHPKPVPAWRAGIVNSLSKYSGEDSDDEYEGTARALAREWREGCKALERRHADSEAGSHNTRLEGSENSERRGSLEGRGDIQDSQTSSPSWTRESDDLDQRRSTPKADGLEDSEREHSNREADDVSEDGGRRFDSPNATSENSQTDDVSDITSRILRTFSASSDVNTDDLRRWAIEGVTVEDSTDEQRTAFRAWQGSSGDEAWGVPRGDAWEASRGADKNSGGAWHVPQTSDDVFEDDAIGDNVFSDGNDAFTNHGKGDDDAFPHCDVSGHEAFPDRYDKGNDASQNHAQHHDDGDDDTLSNHDDDDDDDPAWTLPKNIDKPFNSFTPSAPSKGGRTGAKWVKRKKLQKKSKSEDSDDALKWREPKSPKERLFHWDASLWPEREETPHSDTGNVTERNTSVSSWFSRTMDDSLFNDGFAENTYHYSDTDAWSPRTPRDGNFSKGDNVKDDRWADAWSPKHDSGLAASCDDAVTSFSDARARLSEARTSFSDAAATFGDDSESFATSFSDAVFSPANTGIPTPSRRNLFRGDAGNVFHQNVRHNSAECTSERDQNSEALSQSMKSETTRTAANSLPTEDNPDVLLQRLLEQGNEEKTEPAKQPLTRARRPSRDSVSDQRCRLGSITEEGSPYHRQNQNQNDLHARLCENVQSIEEARREHQCRMDAWVSSIQTHWDSNNSSLDFPFSFENNALDRDDIFSHLPDLEYEELDVNLYMNDDDKRFGFSVIGGYDEGIAPRVDEVTMGSPADRAELEVGDEILEVNGKCVEQCSHAEIISHIHQCIRSKAIRLRVKRLKDGEKVPAISKVHDAYIIAVEESARRKLEDVSANHRVVPVDLTKPPLHRQEEAVTSFRAEPATVDTQRQQLHLELQQRLQLNVQAKQQQVPVQKEQEESIQQQYRPQQHTQQQQKPQNQTQPGQLESVQQESVSEQVPVQPQEKQQQTQVQRQRAVPADLSPVNGGQMPVADRSSKSSPSYSDGLNGSIEMLEMNGVMERERESPKKGKGGKGKKSERGTKTVSNPDTPLIEDLVGRGKLAPNGKTSSNNSLNHSAHDLSMYDPDSDPSFDHSGQNSFSDTGPHREMAIDVPDSFIATVKTPPRYPPPQSSAPSAMPRVPPTTPSKTADSVKDKARTEATLTDAAAVVASSQPKPTMDQLERLRKHQEELRKRREEESRQQAEQEFLRASLRGSKKLQALENKRMAQGQASPPTGIVNTAFIDAEEEAELVDDVDGIQLSLQHPQQRYLKKNTGVEDLLSSLHHIRSRLNSADNTNTTSSSQEVAFLKQLFHNPQFQAAVAMHQMMVDVTSRSPLPRPLGTDAQELAADICNVAPPRGTEPVAKELSLLLNKPLLKNLLKAHDEVAERETRPIIPTQDTELIDYPLLQYGEDSVKIIHLEKTNGEHLGATVKNEGDSVIIARIVKGGAAEKSGLLHEGDEILEVNGIDMRGKHINEVSEILANMSGTITFMIIPAHTCVEEPTTKPNEVMHLRAMFSYDPEDDPYIPCRELGISFLKGDILHATQLTDPNWWQAHREGEEDHHMLAGLIPSKSFQEQREAIRQQLNSESKENKKRSRVCACGRKERKKRKKKKSLYSAGDSEETEEILTYEEVVQYYPQPNRKRPIVLVGPHDTGRRELSQRLMESDFDRFASAVPHTSRLLTPEEQDGRDYHFISRSVFEADVLSGKFIEYGKYEDNLYGTSVEAVRQVINQGKVCVLTLQPESLKMLRNTDLKPYIIFVRPPNMEKLRQLQIALGKPRPTDDQLKEIIEKGREMEETYGHLFDYILVNMNLDRTYEELLQEVNRIETEPQWVPREWIDSYM